MASNAEPPSQVVETVDQSQTASEFIQSQLQLEADAREALPYQFDTCTKDLGPLRQNLFSCLTCNPPPLDNSQPFRTAGVCYACSISCHGEHELVELFTRRNFVCDCGTTRLPSTSTCSLRISKDTGAKGDVYDETPAKTNTYNNNFRNQFCGCGEEYDAHTEKGTMFQCLGLGTIEDGGCGEDWWHPECILGLGREWYLENQTKVTPEKTVALAKAENNDILPDVMGEQNLGGEARESTGEEPTEEERPLPPGFPAEDDFEHLICYKCTTAHPWIKRHVDSPGFLAGVLRRDGTCESPEHKTKREPSALATLNKRKASESELDNDSEEQAKKFKAEGEPPALSAKSETADNICIWSTLPQAPASPISLFLKADFREHLCCCSACFPRLAPHPQLLDEEEIYEPPQSEDGSEAAEVPGSVRSAGSRSLLDRGEAALSNMDRVRAIEGVMAYNHLRDKVKDFLKPFAESGQAVGAEDIKKYFEKLRGDEEAIRTAAMGGGTRDSGDGGESDGRKEQGGY